MTTPAALEIDLHLVNGNTRKFVQSDPTLARLVLQQVNLKVFSQPSLVLAGQDRVSTYPGSALIGISLIMNPIPQELLQLSPFPLLPQEITQEGHQAKQQAPSAAAGTHPQVALAEIEFISGHRVWLEFSVPQTVTGMQERHILHTIFTGPGMICRRLGGGVSIWNRAQMVSFTISSKLEAPSTAWFADPVLP